MVDTGLVDLSGFPIGSLYLALRTEAAHRGIQLFSDTFQNNRTLFLDVGVPEKRIRTVTPKLITTRFRPEYELIKTDLELGLNLPPILSADV
ncbi:MAG: hypothetical protein WC483_01030 [Candidatus Paceibacterota bacterium]